MSSRLPSFWRFLSIGSLVLSTVVATAEAGQSASVTAAQPVLRVFEPAAPGLAADRPRPGLAVTVRADAVRRAAATGNVVELPLADGLTVRSLVSWTQADASQTSFAGRLVDGVDGEATLTMVDDTLVARIVVNGRLFIVRRAADSPVHLVTEIRPGDFPPDGEPLVPSPSEPSAPVGQRELPAASDTNQFVDVMIVYTPAARIAAGGTAAIVAELTAAVNTSNFALANSAVAHRFRLVHSQEVSYVETGDMGTSLSRLRTVGDGFMDDVHLLRDQYHADVVSLLTTEQDACGIGYLLGSPSDTSFQSWAFNVNNWECANGNVTLPHEIGHNMGLHHDRANASGVGARPYGFGYRIPGVARDVMAYPCEFQGLAACPRRTQFSSPRFTFQGTVLPAGTATEDAARALNDTSLLVANFRLSRSVPFDFDGDGKADIGLYRFGLTLNIGGPVPGAWIIARGTTSEEISLPFVGSDATPVPGDYDADGRTDVAEFTASASTWLIRNSSTQTTTLVRWGGVGDIPVPGDYDGDLKTDIAVFRPSNGTWFVRLSKTLTGFTVTWGGAGDIPVVADYDGDGRTDVAVFRPSTGTWYIIRSSNFTGLTITWGGNGDDPVVADYDGDGKADIAVFRPSTGMWYIIRSSTFTELSVWFGGLGDFPIPADYDGDGKADIAVFRKHFVTVFGWGGEWYIVNSSNGTGSFLTFGGNSIFPGQTTVPIARRPR